MDQRRVGAFIARLRQEKGWTQEELGGRLGVTNKTVSRWETGSYMPGIEVLSLMGKEFGVSLNELVEGRRLEGDEDFRTAADQNLASAMERPFDRFWRWLSRNYISVFVVFSLLFILAAVGGESIRYRKAHPVDVSPPGTFACKNVVYDGGMTWIYFTFDHDGRYYIFDAGGKRFEEGRYTPAGDIVELDNGEEVRWAVIKGRYLYDSDPLGDWMRTYEYISGVPTFINFHPPE